MVESLLKVLAKELRRRYPDIDKVVDEMRSRDPFELLVLTELSQITSSKNLWTAFNRLRDSVGTSPESLAGSDVKAIEEAIKPAGLWRIRARRLKELAEEVLERFGGSLRSLGRLSTEELREELLKLPGVGVKTADVVALFSFGRPVMPVDTHIRRIAIRLGLVPPNAKYEEIRRVLEEGLRGEDLAFMHIALIRFGREVCKARSPRCHACPIRGLCPSSKG